MNNGQSFGLGVFIGVLFGGLIMAGLAGYNVKQCEQAVDCSYFKGRGMVPERCMAK